MKIKKELVPSKTSAKVYKNEEGKPKAVVMKKTPAKVKTTVTKKSY